MTQELTIDSPELPSLDDAELEAGQAASCSAASLAPLESDSTATASSRAASSYSRGGTETANSRSDRAYILAGRPAPGPLRPGGLW